MNIHDKARRMVQQSARPMELSEAYALLGRRGQRKARRNHGVLHVTNTDRRSFESVEPGAYWWNREE